ncbi:MAG: hypothetical protein WC780_01585 [Lentimicrobiaceae bacterium]|jgi:hypothetical protein
MLKVNNNANVTIREIEYFIRIRDKNASLAELLDLLKEGLTAFKPNSKPGKHGTDNPVRDFIQANIERSVVIRENTHVYFLNYKEKEDSLDIGFTILVLTNYSVYASLRQELDMLVKDSIAGYFEDLLERHIPVTVTVNSNDNEIITLTDSVTVSEKSLRTKRARLTQIIALAALVISLVFASIYTFTFIDKKHQAENMKLKEDYIDVMLEKKIIEAVKDQKFTVNLYKIADTAGSTKNAKPERKK